MNYVRSQAAPFFKVDQRLDLWLATCPEIPKGAEGLVLTFVPKDSVRGKARPEGSRTVSSFNLSDFWIHGIGNEPGRDFKK